jgi:hypothetical protein
MTDIIVFNYAPLINLHFRQFAGMAFPQSLHSGQGLAYAQV